MNRTGGHQEGTGPQAKQFLKSEDGATAVERAAMLALIVVVCLTSIKALGTNANNKFNAVTNGLS
jgi:pilus assembly protein Flp/PilA